ncbi:MAG: hypothetical protein R2939_08015 [Kofleriaceae bacterium]
MSAPVPPALAALAAARVVDGPPALVFDAAAIDARMAAGAAIARRHRARVLSAAKALPHPALLALARPRLDGVDVAGAAEQALVGDGFGLVSLADPARARWRGAPPPELTISCESVDDVRRARAQAPTASIGLRLSISSLVPGDDAVGALAAGDGHRRSRFGVEVARPGGLATLRAMIAAAAGAPVGVHAHGAGVVYTSPRAWGRLAAAVAALLDEVALAPAFVDLGGGWHGVADELDASLAAVRQALPEVELRLEPGRLWTLGAGFAVGHVRAARELDDRSLRVVSLSRLCHLRWSPVRLLAPPPPPGTGRKVMLVGPTCFEDDDVGQWTLGPGPDGGAPLAVGQPVVLADVVGYALAWNTGFAGVAPAEVVVLDGDRR